MESARLEVRIKRNPWTRTVELVVMHTDGETRSVAEPLIMTRIGEHEAVLPAFELQDNETQLLLDELWRAGFRPTEGVENLGQLKATQDHLEDMRKIAFNRLKINS